MSEQIKQDMNFLEYPLWFQDSRLATRKEEGYTWKKKEGFVYRTGYKPPVKTDYVFLCYLILKSQQEGSKSEIELSRYEVVTACGMVPSKKNYKRLEDSMTRWKMVGLEFRGVFFDGNDYKIMQFGVLDDWDILEDTKLLQVKFNRRWIECVKHSKFFKYLDFNEIKQLHSALPIRLYEILIKAFQRRDVWKTDAFKLAEKIPLAEKYASDIIFKIRTGLEQVRENTSLNVSLTVHRPKRGKAILVFKKMLDKADQDSTETHMPDVQTEDYTTLLDMVPERFRDKKTIQNAIVGALCHYGHERVRRNILYTNSQIRDQKKYRAYLDKSLKNDWGLAYTEDLNDQQEDTQKKRAKVKNAEQQQALEALEAKKVQEKFAALADSQKESLENDFVESIKDNRFLMRFYRKEGLENRTLKKLFEGYLADTLLSENDLKLPLETDLADTDHASIVHTGVINE